MGMHYRIKAYGEQQVIAAVMARLDVWHLMARTTARLYGAEVWTEDG